MPDLICPFGATLVKNDFGCRFADQVVRRGGAEIACLSSELHVSCVSIHAKIKSSALDAMGQEDDLLSLPHSVLVKIQYGGLLGLQAAARQGKDRIEDIAGLISAINLQYQNTDDLPFEDINHAIAEYRPVRRSRK